MTWWNRSDDKRPPGMASDWRDPSLRLWLLLLGGWMLFLIILTVVFYYWSP